MGEADSVVFRDSAKTMEVELGSKRPKEISNEFHRSFMSSVPGVK